MFKGLFLWLEQTCGTDPTAVMTMSVMCMVGAYMTRNQMANPNGAFMIYPFLLMFAILSNFVFDQFGLFDAKKMDQWLVVVSLSAVCGMVVGLSLFILANRGINALIDRHT